MLLQIPELEHRGIRHFFTTKKFNIGETTPFRDRRMFITINQVHGDAMYIIDRPVEEVSTLAEAAAGIQGDAIITNQKNIGIAVITADCVPLLIYDPEMSVIAAVHAGWKGTLNGITASVIRRMSHQFNCRAEDIVVGIGPAIGQCCYSVGDTVTEPLRRTNPEWDIYLKQDGYGKSMLDLTGLNRRQAEDAGVMTGKVFDLSLCTSCNNELFFSYRRDGAGTGRMLSGIMMN